MKTYRHLYPQVIAWENLELAYHSARKGKRTHAPVAAFEFDRERNLTELQEELWEKAYRPGPYHSFIIHEPKRRLISAAPFRDRVVHHALCNVIEPIFEPRFIFDSYANRIGKGTHRALDRCTYFARQYRYVMPCDVRQFFPSIDHAILRTILARYLADPDVMELIDRILAGLRLTIHEHRAQPRPVTEGVPFLGFVVYPDHRRLRRRKGIYFQQRFKRLVAEFAAGRLSLDDLNATVQGWVNHARTGDTWGLRRAVLGALVLPGGVQ